MTVTTTMATVSVTGISSMATRALLAELAAAYEARSGQGVAIESAGVVDVAKRVQAGEPFDVVVLARDALDKLGADGHLVPGSAVDLARSGLGVAVRAGVPRSARPAIDTEEALQRAVLAAPTIGYATGPSGGHLATLFERWGIAEAVQERVVTAPPGVAVGALVARGEVALGFQQLSELIHLNGIEILGPLPPAVQIVTTFSGAVSARARAPEEARALLAFLASPDAAAAKRRQGMEP